MAAARVLADAVQDGEQAVEPVGDRQEDPVPELLHRRREGAGAVLDERAGGLLAGGELGVAPLEERRGRLADAVGQLAEAGRVRTTRRACARAGCAARPRRGSGPRSACAARAGAGGRPRAGRRAPRTGEPVGETVTLARERVDLLLELVALERQRVVLAGAGSSSAAVSSSTWVCSSVTRSCGLRQADFRARPPRRQAARVGGEGRGRSPQEQDGGRDRDRGGCRATSGRPHQRCHAHLGVSMGSSIPRRASRPTTCPVPSAPADRPVRFRASLHRLAPGTLPSQLVGSHDPIGCVSITVYVPAPPLDEVAAQLRKPGRRISATRPSAPTMIVASNAAGSTRRRSRPTK